MIFLDSPVKVRLDKAKNPSNATDPLTDVICGTFCWALHKVHVYLQMNNLLSYRVVL
jgi:hypothetical protein